MLNTSRFNRERTSLQIFLQASTTSIQLLLGEREGPFTRKLWEVEVRKFSLQVLVQDGKLTVAFGTQLSTRHVHIVHLGPKHPEVRFGICTQYKTHFLPL